MEHIFEVVIEGVTGLKLAESMIWGEADCFVQYHFPSQTTTNHPSGATLVQSQWYDTYLSPVIFCLSHCCPVISVIFIWELMSGYFSSSSSAYVHLVIFCHLQLLIFVQLSFLIFVSINQISLWCHLFVLPCLFHLFFCVSSSSSQRFCKVKNQSVFKLRSQHVYKTK